MDNKKEEENTGKFENNYGENARRVLEIIKEQEKKRKKKAHQEAENNKER